MKAPPSNGSSGFTLVELIAAVAIIGILASMLLPEFSRYKRRAESIVCANNLRQIGVAVLSYAAENENAYPIIEPNPQDPVYQDGEFMEMEVKPMLDALSPFGITEATLKCPTDVKGPNWFAKVDPATSYQWRVMVDGENAISPKIYGGRRGYGVRIVKPSRVTICTDFEAIHSGRMNRLFADGHVSKPN